MAYGGNYRLNPNELAQIQYIQQMMNRPGTGDFGQMIPQIIAQAQQRRATNVQEAEAERQAALQARSQGITTLEQQAMQLASQGATQEALMNALTGQAENLPLMNGPRGQGMLGDLAGFVGGLYDQGPVSGLAPADYRNQFNTGLLDTADQGGIGAEVIKGLQGGMSFVNIRDRVRQLSIAAGYDDAQAQAAMQHAEDVYQQLTGVSLADMRSAADMLRTMPAEQVPSGIAAAAVGQGPYADVTDNQRYDRYMGSPLFGEGNPQAQDPQFMLGALAKDPQFAEIVQNLVSAGNYRQEAMPGLLAWASNQQPRDTFSVWHPSTWFGG